ncbi:MAG: hypothetical protein JW999_09970 [Methanotrichaceae archaeon]|nr:hypothetical protein [Methanotrichaceae archaeon]
MNTIAGWDGPDCIADGIFRYSKYISWIRLSIDVVGGEFYGGTCGASNNFVVEREAGQWMRFEISPAWTANGEPVLRLREYSTWDVVYERVSEGRPIDEEMECIEELAAFLERCFSP